MSPTACPEPAGQSPSVVGMCGRLYGLCRASSKKKLGSEKTPPVWAEKNGITHSVEGATQLRAGFDEHVVTWVTAADAKCKHVKVRLLAHQLQTGGQPPRVGAPPTVAAAAQAAAAALEPGHTGGGGLATIEEMLMITGRRIEVKRQHAQPS